LLAAQTQHIILTYLKHNSAFARGSNTTYHFNGAQT